MNREDNLRWFHGRLAREDAERELREGLSFENRLFSITIYITYDILFL